ncbi:hypothetical protein D3C76_1666700 [compost metagenome]
MEFQYTARNGSYHRGMGTTRATTVLEPEIGGDTMKKLEGGLWESKFILAGHAH